MRYLSKWETDLLSVLVHQFECGDFNCGANEEEMKSVGCPKDGEHIISPPDCDTCKWGKRFNKLKSKVGAP
jgi:hypothetical protein